MPRFMKREYVLELVTPAFLGGADQSAEWRTPGIKALIRQWWRVVYVAKHGMNVDKMRDAEYALFGTVNEASGGVTQAQLRVRLGEWTKGNLTSMPASGTTSHPEVNGGMNIGTFLYLGYGPLGFQRGGVKLNNEYALNTTQKNTLVLIGKDLDESTWNLVDHAMQLIHLFGTIGGRSRNGWGSVALSSNDRKPIARLEEVKLPLLDIMDCFKYDWGSAIGQKDNKSLLWMARMAYPSWERAMNELARIKIALRTQAAFKFTSNIHPVPEPRHYLSYPITNHAVSAWGNQKRIPNSLRFKVIKTDNGQYLPIVVHLPHKLPSIFKDNKTTIELASIWQNVYSQLDQDMTRI